VLAHRTRCTGMGFRRSIPAHDQLFISYS